MLTSQRLTAEIDCLVFSCTWIWLPGKATFPDINILMQKSQQQPDGMTLEIQMKRWDIELQRRISSDK